MNSLTNKSSIIAAVLLAAFIVGTFNPAMAQVQDQDKLFRDPVEGFILYYSDDNVNTYHDPSETYYDYVNGTVFRQDASCWMASATNVLTHAGLSNDFLDWLGNGIVPSPIANPWGDIFSVGGGGSHLTFDDGGYSNWVFEELEIPLYGPIITTTEFAMGGWGIDPIAWCQAKLNSGSPVVIDLWWGDARRGWLPTGFSNAPEGYYHAITLWEINETTQTMVITDSDDVFNGSREVTYTFVGNDWVIDELYPGWPGRINYAAGANFPITSVPGMNNWGIVALILLIILSGTFVIRKCRITA